MTFKTKIDHFTINEISKADQKNVKGGICCDPPPENPPKNENKTNNTSSDFGG